MGCISSKLDSGSINTAGFSSPSTLGTQGLGCARPFPASQHDFPERQNTPAAGQLSASIYRRASLPGKSATSRAETIVVGGTRHTSIDAMNEPVKQALLNAYHPELALGLDDETRLYRVTEGWRVRSDKIVGNPTSMATILHHQAVEEDPRYTPGVETEQYLYDRSHTVQPYKPVTVSAKDLPHPTLNVMHGEMAAKGALAYLEDGFTLVEMKLGDLREAGGGDVFFDAILSGDERSIPLIVTLPKGKSVRVTTIDPSNIADHDLSDSD